MPDLSEIQASNALIETCLLPPTVPLVGVFVGATSGIGKSTLFQFAKHLGNERPFRIYYVGRSQQAADETAKSLHKVANPGLDRTYSFIKADVSLIGQVDEVCRQIRSKEKYVNVLYQSQGTLDVAAETSENLNLLYALAYYSRMRFIENLLPLLQEAPSIARVIIVHTGTKEGAIDVNDIGRKKVPSWKQRAHGSSMNTLTLEYFAERAPTVSFIHSYPGYVATPLMNTLKGIKGTLVRTAISVMASVGLLHYISVEESGHRHIYYASSARFPPKQPKPELYGGEFGVKVNDGSVAVGSNGRVGSGVYSVDEHGDTASPEVQKLLEDFRRDGVRDKVCRHFEETCEQITGMKSIYASD